ncbi:hypothetical protein ACFOOM_00850 [Streptomyces echinoruber]|uniref:Minor tail protein n=1 Tax=Streptomyces echinoruber TaxID=68898 RepID=A0A918QW52_9ACTN|nr:hypothetical protein [Streptomyces echinoruber]GGZ73322.1 hypothetical protein GCM10010389_08650 [Streptomyces echinoruber]
MLTDYISVGGVEIANTARLREYLRTVGSPLDSGDDICACDTLTAGVLGDEPYTTPDDPASPAPWYDPDDPASAEFAGFLVLQVEGVDDFPVRRSVTTAVTGGGSLGPARVQPREIVVSGILLGATCCGVEFGLRFLTQALQGCTGSQCGGDCVTMYDCCPGEEMTPEQFNAAHRRTYRRVALTSGPAVTGRAGTGSCGGGRCSIGADIVSVEFTLTAATPWAYTDEVPLLDVNLPADDDSQCITWCLHDSTGACADGACRLAPCVDTQNLCADPSCVPPAPPVPTMPQTCFCQALATNAECYEIDLSNRSGWIDDVPVINVFAGTTDLRRLTISLYQRTAADEGLTCAQLAEKKRCDPYARWEVAFLPAGAELLLDGQTGRATMDCNRQCSTATTVYGRDGAPPTWPVLNCAEFCLCLETDAFVPPSPDASLSLSISGRA